MAGTIKTNAVQLGDSATATQNFTLRTNVDGTATLARGNVGATTQDILTIDAAGVASLLGKLVFSRGNVLGTVSQAGGVPTGAVVESGSGPNGSYTRWADGTQICTERKTVSITATAAGSVFRDVAAIGGWTYPAPFIAPPTNSVSIAGTVVWGTMDVNTATATGARVAFSAIALTATAVDVHSMATGRWF